jgi:gliding motility-associated-like protein
VFTPDNNDNRNDAFDIDIVGFTKYELQIFNRWGREVFMADKDGVGNDGINWNGKDHNEGEICAAGVYYFIFSYKLITEQSPKTVHGTITLIR